MRTSCVLCAAASGVLALCVLCSAVPPTAPPATAPNPPYAFARGWANLLGGWLEIPRGVIYENTRIPVVGFAVGPVKGTFLTLWRELAGGMDVVCFGVTRQGLYTHDVPEFVWDATWMPVCSGAAVCDEPMPPLRRVAAMPGALPERRMAVPTAPMAAPRVARPCMPAAAGAPWRRRATARPRGRCA